MPQPNLRQKVGDADECPSCAALRLLLIGCVLGKRRPAFLYIVKSDGERNRFGQFCAALSGHKGGLDEGHRQQSCDPTGEGRNHPIRALAG